MSDASAMKRAEDGERMLALERYDILDTPQEETFDRITRLASRLFRTPMSTISLIDGHRQWFKSRQGIAGTETGRGSALCNYAIQQQGALVIPDTLADERFSRNPCVIGDPHVRFYAGAPLRTPDGHAIGTLCVVDTAPRTFSGEDVSSLCDLARLVVDQLEFRSLATTDSLTGALSRRAFREEAARALSLAGRHRHDLTLIMLDLDHFKAINDQHGHHIGDAVLSSVAAACRANLRKSDLFGRLGGEEFAILLQHTGRENASKVAGKLRRAIARLQVPAEHLETIGVTASFGIASIDRTVSDLDDLLKRADEALYAAKADGRNTCVEWQRSAAPVSTVRRRVFKAGKASFNAGSSVIDCTVRSLSDEGAGLDVVSTAGLPNQFKLRIDSDGLSRLCRVLAKQDRHVEVAFE